MKIKLNSKKVREFIDNNNILITGIIGTTVTATIGYGLITFANKEKKIDTNLSNIYYTTEDQKEISLSNLYYVEKNNQKYICTREIIDIDEMPIIPIIYRNIYKYIDIKTNEIICTDKDNNTSISNVFGNLKNELINNDVNIGDVNQEYIEGKILVKSK